MPILSAPAPRVMRRFAAARALLVATVALAALAGPGLQYGARADDKPLPTRVRIETNLGDFTIEVNAERAPLSAANFLDYVRSGHYTGTIFHRVINNFVIQGGGFDTNFKLKTPRAPVSNESGNGLSNRRGTVGLARSDLPHSGNCQFYVNLNDNDDLDPQPLRWGYAVFGKVVEGMDTIDKIGHVATGSAGPFPKDAPTTPIVIKSATIIEGAALPAAAAPGGASPAPTPANPAAAAR